MPLRSRTRRLLLGLAVAVLLVALTALVIRHLMADESVRAALQQQLSETSGEPVTIDRARLRIFPELGLELVGIDVGEPARIHIGRLTIATGLRGLLARRVEGAHLIVRDTTAEIGALMALVARSSAADTPARPRVPAFTVVSVREIVFDGVTLTANGHEAQVDMEASLSGRRLAVERLTASAAGTKLTASGAFENLSGPAGRLTVEAGALDLDRLLEFAAAVSSAASGGSGRASSTSPSIGGKGLDVSLDVTAASGQARGFAFTGLATTARLRPGEVVLSPLALATLGGQASGDARLEFREDSTRVHVRGTLAGVGMERIAGRAGHEGVITGSLTARLDASGAGTTVAEALQALRGRGEFEVVNGRLPALPIVRAAVLAFGHATDEPPAGSGDAFTRLGATATLDRGVVRTNDLSFDSRDVDLSAQGSVDLRAATLDLTANVILSRELSAQAGRDLVRYASENGQVVLPAKLTGSAASPRVWIDAPRALERAIKGELERRTRSLLDRLLDR